MSPHSPIRQARRNFMQRFLTDPAVALIAVLFWGIFKILPPRQASNLGGFLGGIAGHLMHRRNHIGLVNLGIAFPDKSPAERQKILTAMWHHWGRFYAEMPHAYRLFEQARIVGLEYLRQAVADGTGGLVCSAHLGNWELAVSQPLFDHFYLNPVYRPANNPWLDKLMFQRRTGILIPKGETGARQILNILRAHGFVVMLCDQKLREGIPVPFFGKEAMTPPAIAVLALKFRVPLFMARVIRQPDTSFVVEVSPPLPLPRDNTPETVAEVMRTINARYETWIRENPEQWLWIHRRFDKSEYT